MYKTRPLSLLLLALLCQFTFGQIVNIPDANFKNALLNNFPEIDTNNDGEIQVSEAEATTIISAFSQGINSLVGIEAFVNLERLVCFNNPIASVDFSNNTQLQQISMSFTDLSEIDISNNLQLSFISLGYTSISDIDVVPHSNLEYLDIDGTNITSVDVTNNTGLKAISLIKLNGVTSIDLSNNLLLESIALRETGITSFDFSIFPSLKILDVGFTNFTDVDLSNNPQMCFLRVRDCSLLNTINIQNGNTQGLAPGSTCSVDFTIGGLTSQSGLNASPGCPNLDLICVDDIQFATDNFNQIPTQTQFVEDCSVLSVDSYSLQEAVLLNNPVTDNLTIESTQNIKTVSIFSITGKQILSEESDTNILDIDVSYLTSGLYFVVLETTEERVEVLKFLKK